MSSASVCGASPVPSPLLQFRFVAQRPSPGLMSTRAPGTFGIRKHPFPTRPSAPMSVRNPISPIPNTIHKSYYPDPTTTTTTTMSTPAPPKPPSRPATPLRRSNSRSSLRDGGGSGDEPFPLNALAPQFAELSDAMATLEADMGDLQIMHDSVSRFSESFASFLYGLNMNAFCMDFTEAPIKESFRRAAEHEASLGRSNPYEPDQWRAEQDAEATFMTTDTSFVREPRAPSPTPTASTIPKAPPRRGGSSRGSGRGGAVKRGRGLRYSK